MKPRQTRANRAAGRRRSFTLVEVIVAGVITALVVGSVSSSLGQLGRAKDTSKRRYEAYMRADAALNSIRADIIAVIRSDDLFDTRLLIYDESLRTPAGDMDRDEILVFNTRLRPVRNIDNFNGEGMEYESQYRIEVDDFGPVLWQRRDAIPDEYLMGGGVATPIVEGITGLLIEAYDGHDWYEQWDSDIDGLPLAVRIIVTASGHRPQEDPYDAPLVTLRTALPIDRVLTPRDVLEEEYLLAEELEQALEAAEQQQQAAEEGAGGSGGTIPRLGDTSGAPMPGADSGGPGRAGGGPGAAGIHSGQSAPPAEIPATIKPRKEDE